MMLPVHTHNATQPVIRSSRFTRLAGRGNVTIYGTTGEREKRRHVFAEDKAYSLGALLLPSGNTLRLVPTIKERAVRKKKSQINNGANAFLILCGCLNAAVCLFLAVS